MVPDLVIFDCDGVLVDSELLACTVDAEELTNAGYRITAAEVVRRFSGVPTRELLAQVERDAGCALPADLSERIERRVLDRYHGDLRAVTAVAETVANLPWPYCVASSSRPSKLGLGLIETRLFDLFYPNIFSTALVQNGKPSPEIFLYAARQMSARPERCIVVEDSIPGITGARAAGMRAVGFVGGAHCASDHSDSLYAAGAEVIFDSFTHFLEIVQKL
jgi:HAD superfamily hydrolase (TIGR01509 family)